MQKRPDAAQSPATCLDEQGVATIWAAWWMLGCALVAVLVFAAVAATAYQHRLDGAADLVAVSAAARLQRGGDACETAANVAEANHVDLAECRLDATDVVVTVTESLSLPFAVRGRLTAEARAGP